MTTATADATERTTAPTPTDSGSSTPAAPAAPETASSKADPISAAASAKTDSTPSTDAASGKETEAGKTQTESAAPVPDWRSVLETVDPRELLKDPRIAGHVGALAEKQARKLARAEIDAQKAKDEQARLDHLAQNDPLAFIDERNRLKQEADSAEERRKALYGEMDSVLYAGFYAAPDPVKAKLGGKSYTEGTEAERRLAFLTDYGEGMFEHGAAEAKKQFASELQKEKARWEKDELPALRKQVLAETNGAEPSPDTGTGAGRVGTIDQDEWNRHRKDAQWVAENWDQINKSVSAGIIRR